MDAHYEAELEAVLFGDGFNAEFPDDETVNNVARRFNLSAFDVEADLIHKISEQDNIWSDFSRPSVVIPEKFKAPNY